MVGSQSMALVMKPLGRTNVAGMPEARMISPRSWSQRAMAGIGVLRTEYEDTNTPTTRLASVVDRPIPHVTGDHDA
jgi:hypothetical protein